MSIFLLLLLISFTSILSQEIIWYDPMNTSDFSWWAWKGVTHHLYQKHTGCPGGDSNNCWRICNNDGIDYAYRHTSTRGYTDIYIKFDLKPSDMSKDSEYCSFQFNINANTDSNWYQIYEYGVNEVAIIDKIVTLNESSWDNINVGIKLEPRDTANDCCWMANFYLMGTPIPDYITISGTWMNNNKPYPPSGWTYTNITQLVQDDIVTPSNTLGSVTWHGPYASINSGTTEVQSLEQSFYCEVKSRVDVTWGIAICGTESNDFVDLYFNGIATSKTQLTMGAITATPFADTALDPYCNTGWEYIDPVGISRIDVVDVNELFNVRFITTTNAPQSEAVALYIQFITCTPITNPPTPNPTPIPTPATSTPTINPVAINNLDTIWYTGMDSLLGLSNWTVITTTPIVQKISHTGCNVAADENCWTVCSIVGDAKNGYIYRMHSTIGYQNIAVTFTIDPWSMQDPSEFCLLQYSIDNQVDYADWTQFHYSTYSDHFEDVTIFLPKETWDNIGVGIKIWAQDNAVSCCYVSDFYLQGIPITTEPTTSPTTAFPTTYIPTTSEPTTSTPTTSTPITNSPVTMSPTTGTPTTDYPTTENPTTIRPTTNAPTTESPITYSPVTSTPLTSIPVTSIPITNVPSTYVTNTPVTSAPVTSTPITNNPTTKTPTEGVGEVTESAQETETNAHDPTSDNGLQTNSESFLESDLFFIIVIVLGLYLCCLICIIFCIKKRRKKEEIDINIVNMNNDNIMMTQTKHPNINQVPSTSTLVEDNGFEANLTNLTGANNLLMDDVVNDFGSYNSDDDVIHVGGSVGFGNTAGGPNMNEQDEDVALPTTSTNPNDINDDNDVIVYKMNDADEGGGDITNEMSDDQIVNEMNDFQYHQTLGGPDYMPPVPPLAPHVPPVPPVPNNDNDVDDIIDIDDDMDILGNGHTTRMPIDDDDSDVPAPPPPPPPI